MQTTSSEYAVLALNKVRFLTHRVSIAFTKVFNETTQFFTLDESELDSPDLLAPVDSNILSEWNKYEYTDYTDRVMAFEWSREIDFFHSIAASMADITLANHDDFFTRGSGSPIDANLLGRRPIRIEAGFNHDNLPQFVGLTEKAPQVDRASRTATLHAQDFLSFIFARKLPETVMLENKRIDEILTTLYVAVGVTTTQLRFDKARTTVPFVFFDKNQTLGEITRDLMKSEMGSLYMDEEGYIVFLNRLRQGAASVENFTEDEIIEYDNSDETNIVNSVSVKASVLIVQPKEPVFDLPEPMLIRAGETISKFFEFQNPVTEVDDIEFYIGNSAEDGLGTDLTSSINIVSQTSFGTTLLVEIENTGLVDLYVTDLIVYGTPVMSVKTADIVERDQTSIDAFEEQTLEIESPYIQDEDTARSIALTIVRHFKEYGNTIRMRVQGNFARQVADVIAVSVDGINDEFIIRKIENARQPGVFEQVITAQKYEIPTYFVLDQSELDGAELLAP